LFHSPDRSAYLEGGEIVGMAIKENATADKPKGACEQQTDEVAMFG
jgi:hypothetical protein